MSRTPRKLRIALAASAALLLGTTLALPVIAQTPPPAAATPGPSPSRQAIEARKAIFVLIGANFRPLGEIVKGNKAYDAAEVSKRLARIEFLSQFLDDAFPEVSNTGLPDTKAKADIWTKHDDFAKKVSDFQAHTKSLVQVNATEKGATDAFKAAFATVGGDCKGCHDDFKEK